MKVVFYLGLLTILISTTADAQDIKKCRKNPSAMDSKKIDVHCSCMEKLIEVNIFYHLNRTNILARV